MREIEDTEGHEMIVDYRGAAASMFYVLVVMKKFLLLADVERLMVTTSECVPNRSA